MTILVFGGSGGARGINSWILECLSVLSDLKDSVQWLHITGNADATENAKVRYKEHGFHAVVTDYSNEMGRCYASADLVVCRAGATTLAELSATQLPAILIPYPYATNDHQRKNAYEFQKYGAIVIEEGNLKTNIVTDQINDLLADPDNYAKVSANIKSFAKPEAATVVAQELLSK